MTKIEQCLYVYKDFLNKDFFLTLENGIVLHIFFQKSNFSHLVGLHKLKDLEIANRTGSAIYKDLERGRITQSDLEKSDYYYLIQNRVNHFPKIDQIFGKKIIVDFNPALLSSCKLNAEYILYQNCGSAYIHLAIGHSVRGYYPESFFYDITPQYLSGQILLDVTEIRIEEKRRGKQVH